MAVMFDLWREHRNRALHQPDGAIGVVARSSSANLRDPPHHAITLRRGAVRDRGDRVGNRPKAVYARTALSGRLIGEIVD